MTITRLSIQNYSTTPRVCFEKTDLLPEHRVGDPWQRTRNPGCRHPCKNILLCTAHGKQTSSASGSSLVYRSVAVLTHGPRCKGAGSKLSIDDLAVEDALQQHSPANPPIDKRQRAQPAIRPRCGYTHQLLWITTSLPLCFSPSLGTEAATLAESNDEPAEVWNLRKTNNFLSGDNPIQNAP